MSVRRVYAEKKKGFRGAAESLAHEVRNYLGIPELKGIRILIRYDVENISDVVFREAEKCVFSEPPVDDLTEETFPVADDERVFAVEYLPGQCPRGYGRGCTTDHAWPLHRDSAV